MSQVQLPKIRRKVLGDQLADRLAALPGPAAVAVFRGEVSAEGRWPQAPGATGPLKLPDSDRVESYLVLFDGTGTTDLEPDLGYCSEDLRWGPQITVVSAFSVDCTHLVDRVCFWVRHWSPVLQGVAAGRLEPPPGYDPGPPRPDRTVTPLRYYVPLQWRLDLTT